MDTTLGSLVNAATLVWKPDRRVHAPEMRVRIPPESGHSQCIQGWPWKPAQRDPTGAISQSRPIPLRRRTSRIVRTFAPFA